MKEVCPHNLVTCFLCNNHVACNCPDCSKEGERVSFDGVSAAVKELKRQACQEMIKYLVNKQPSEAYDGSTGEGWNEAIDTAKEYLDSISK